MGVSECLPKERPIKQTLTLNMLLHAFRADFYLKKFPSVNIQGDSKLLSEFAWTIIFKPEIIKQNFQNMKV
jgi:hypothetical protein